jgi:hypothetical protein
MKRGDLQLELEATITPLENGISTVEEGREEIYN